MPKLFFTSKIPVAITPEEVELTSRLTSLVTRRHELLRQVADLPATERMLRSSLKREVRWYARENQRIVSKLFSLSVPNYRISQAIMAGVARAKKFTQQPAAL